MTTEKDEHFFDRADSFINLANKQVEEISRGKVSASFMYALARFNAWVSASGFSTGEEMRGEQENTVEYFVTQYRAMLIENLEDYAKHFDKYMRSQLQ